MGPNFRVEPLFYSTCTTFHVQCQEVLDLEVWFRNMTAQRSVSLAHFHSAFHAGKLYLVLEHLKRAEMVLWKGLTSELMDPLTSEHNSSQQQLLQVFPKTLLLLQQRMNLTILLGVLSSGHQHTRNIKSRCTGHHEQPLSSQSTSVLSFEAPSLISQFRTALFYGA